MYFGPKLFYVERKTIKGKSKFIITENVNGKRELYDDCNKRGYNEYKTAAKWARIAQMGGFDVFKEYIAEFNEWKLIKENAELLEYVSEEYAETAYTYAKEGKWLDQESFIRSFERARNVKIPDFVVPFIMFRKIKDPDEE